MRIIMVLLPQSMSLRPWMMFLRACSLSSGATASSRSKKMTSAPDDKEQARKNIIQGLNDIDWGNKTMMIRINGLDTHYAYRDVVDVLENCPRLDMILIPKVGVPQDVYAIDMLVTQIEQFKKYEKKIGLELLIETALGMANVEAIAQSSPRVEAMSFGVADYAASTRARTMGIGAPHPDYGILSDKDDKGNRTYYWNDPWHYA